MGQPTGFKSLAFALAYGLGFSVASRLRPLAARSR